MDRKIERKKGWRVAFTQRALPWWGAGILALLIVYLFMRDSSSTLRVDGSSITVSDVVAGEFNDYIRISGQVRPLVTIQISPQEGGTVEEIFVEEGADVKKGTPLVRLTNDNLDMQILNSEAELAEKENILRNTLISMEQQRISIRQEILQLSIDVRRLKRAYNQQKQLFDERLIAKEDYLKAEEDYELANEKLKLVIERQKQDSIYRSIEVAQMQESLNNMRLNMQMIRRRKENLVIKAPIDGQLGVLDAVLGENIGAGAKIGQISDMTNYKIETRIDEHYIDKVMPGLTATVERQGTSFETSLRKVYPEVKDGKFNADFKFCDSLPDNLRSGQTYYLNLQLGQPSEAVLISRGTFYQKTGGRWIYVLSADGATASKRSITIGRQNPNYYEVIDGLTPGERVIVSGYETYGDNEKLILR